MPHTLRILQISPYYAGAWAYGGIPRAAVALCEALARRGHTITVATTDVCDDRTRLTAVPESGKVVVRVFPNRSNRLAYYQQVFTPRGLKAYLRAELGRFDVVHVHGHRHALEVHAADACLACGVPFVVTPNGTAPRIERRRMAKALFDAVVGNRILRRATFVTAVTNAERRQLESLGIDGARIRMLPNSVDLSEFPSGTAERRRDQITPPAVLFLGKLTPRKGVDVLVRAFAAMDRDAELRVAGNDMGAGRAARSLAQSLGIAARVTWLGLLRGPERLRALSDADLVVYPSRDEVFGLVALEALLCGTPVIVGNDSGCAEIVREVGGGTDVPPGDPIALAMRIGDMLQDRLAWRTRARAAAEMVRQRYGSDRIALVAEAIYFDARGSRLEATA